MMRGTSIGRRLPSSTSLSKHFSTSSGGGGRGRGGGIPFHFDFSPPSPGEKPDSDNPKPDPDESIQSPIPPGLGHGRGRPFPSPSSIPSFSSFLSGVGRGRGGTQSAHPPASEPVPPQRPIGNSQDSRNLPEGVVSVLSGAGRGLPSRKPVSEGPVKEDNRHIRARERRPSGPTQQRLSPEEARKKAVEILSRGGEGGPGRGGRGGRERGGAFLQRGTGRGRGRGRGRVSMEDEDEDESELFLGNDVDGENLAKKFGPEIMDKLAEGFEEMSDRVLPSPMNDAFLDAFHTNCMIEFEPEYLVEFDNPDIDEKPPMPLSEALEKMKPFLMAYEGIQSQEEWEQAVNELMGRLPVLKEIVDYYSGPDRVTAKQQQKELERVAKTLPESSPASVKRFADRAVLSLQSNPGWGWDKKCQFMDKFVREVSEHYKC